MQKNNVLIIFCELCRDFVSKEVRNSGMEVEFV